MKLSLTTNHFANTWGAIDKGTCHDKKVCLMLCAFVFFWNMATKAKTFTQAANGPTVGTNNLVHCFSCSSHIFPLMGRNENKKECLCSHQDWASVVVGHHPYSHRTGGVGGGAGGGARPNIPTISVSPAPTVPLQLQGGCNGFVTASCPS